MPTRLSWRSVLALMSASAVLAYGFTVLLGRYWSFYHLDTPGTGAGLLFFVLPGSFVLGLGLSVLTVWSRVHRGRPLRRALALGVAVSSVALVALFALELWSTSAKRSGEGEGAGDLAPFAASLVGHR